jgi:hypothetical protein
MHRCKANRADGKPCEARPADGGEYCWFHDPKKAAKRTAAQRAGGAANRARTLGPGAEDVPLQNPEDVAALLALTINQLRRGEMDVKISNGITYISTVLLKALEAGDVAERLERLERAVSPFPISTSTFDPHPFRELEA